MTRGLSALLWQRDGLTPLVLTAGLRVVRLTWSWLGGPESALLEAEPAAAEEALLGCPLSILDEDGTPCWWGYIHSLERYHGRVGLRLSLEEVANRVAVTYRPRLPQADATLDAECTAWAEDAFSQRLFGIKERLLDGGRASPAQALAARDTHLRHHALPHWQAFRIAVEEQKPRLILRARGWWHTLTWVYTPRSLAFEGFLVPSDTTQSLGRSTSDVVVAQSFRLENGPQTLAEVALHLGNSGRPTDSLLLSLCQEQNGQPGAVLASTSVPASATYAGRTWVHFVFQARPTLQAGVTYWLRLERSGAPSSANYYRLSVDDSDPYPRGLCLLGSSSGYTARSGGLADIAFYLSSVHNPVERLEAWLAGAAGQFLNGLVVRAEPQGEPALPQDGLQPCATAIAALLAQGDAGGRLLYPQVRSDRTLVIDALPEPDPPRLRLDDQGRLCSAEGGRWPLARMAAGEWTRLPGHGATQALHLRRVGWQPASGLIPLLAKL